MFLDLSDVNAAYSVAVQYVNLSDAGSSAIVAKAATGHQCWFGTANGGDCADFIEGAIQNWAADSDQLSQRAITLTAPDLRDPGDAKSFPLTADTLGSNGSSFESTVHPLLTTYCQDCHTETAAPLPIAPFFANDDPDSSFESAKPKMNIDEPALSRFVVRLSQESHNCWSDCAANATEMQTAITDFADGIDPTPIDPNLVTSKALNLGEGIVASGGNRHETNQFAIWEFKTGTGDRAFDSSGISPAITLQINGSREWLGGFGLDLTNGYAIASNFDSVKLKTFIESTGQYAIEAWVIPANVTQEDASIVSYSGGSTRNFTLGQDLYNYEFYNRYESADALAQNGEPFYTTGDSGMELLQSSLQHVVANYDPFEGRTVYINGELVAAADPIADPTSIGSVAWDDNFAFSIGGDVAGVNNWDGQIRMVAIHNRTLTEEQILQNFDVGVGAKFFLLFHVGDHIGIADAYVMMTVAQFDNYSYLFSSPTFVNLDENWTPIDIPIEGIRIGINGKEATAGQAFANLITEVNATDYDPQLGQVLSSIGTIIALEKSVEADEFFLTFERLGDETNVVVEPIPTPPDPPVDPSTPVVADIGVRTFEEISASIAAITGIPVDDTRTFNGNPVSVKGTYDTYIQQLPAVASIDAFLPAHQMAIAQLSIASCNTLVEANPGYFAGFDMNQNAQDAFGPPPAAAYYNPAQPTGSPTTQQNANRSVIIDTMMTSAMNVDQADASNNLTSQPEPGLIGDPPTVAAVPGIGTMLGSDESQDLGVSGGVETYNSLITQMLGCTPPLPPADQECAPLNTPARTRQIVKAVCASAVGSAVMLIQ